MTKEEKLERKLISMGLYKYTKKYIKAYQELIFRRYTTGDLDFHIYNKLIKEISLITY